MLAGGLINGTVYFDFRGSRDVSSGFFDNTAAVLNLACSVLLGRRAVNTGAKTVVRVRGSGLGITLLGEAVGNGYSRRH